MLQVSATPGNGRHDTPVIYLSALFPVMSPTHTHGASGFYSPFTIHYSLPLTPCTSTSSATVRHWS